MGILERIKLYISITESEDIIRRYFVNNTFDSALMTLGIIFGIHTTTSDPRIVIAATLGATVATFTSGMTSAYLSEVAEKKAQLKEIQDAMLTKLTKSLQVQASKTAPIIMAVVNGISPVIGAALIISPYILNIFGIIPATNIFIYSLLIALSILFFLGAFLGKVSNENIFLAGFRTILIALLTMAILFLLSYTKLL
ncbi:VIT1/CCC1 transporter family protein [Candidatus Woesearchaeota archaeon]|nr:VIT1/CCC1 transporter family protein [Candidatus Woesearchaeota archaeon]